MWLGYLLYKKFEFEFWVDYIIESDVKSIIIMYDATKVFERHHVALKINNRLH